MFRPKRTVVVSLDINANDPQFEDFASLDEFQKIAFIKKRIQEICEKLDPNDNWTIAWREMGIHDTNMKLTSNTAKKALKKEFSELSWQYPNLTIVAGTVVTKKTTSLIKPETLLSYYEKHTHLHDDLDFIEHKKPLEDFIESKKTTTAPIDVLRNTCYIFKSAPIHVMEGLPFASDLHKYASRYIFTKSPLALTWIDKDTKAIPLKVENKSELKKFIEKIDISKNVPLQTLLKKTPALLQPFVTIITENIGHDHIQRIDKIAPFKELTGVTDESNEDNTFFKVGGKKSKNMEHFFGDTMVEICMEHSKGVAQHEAKELKLPMPKLQLILSASTYAETRFFAAENVAHFDSNYRPVLFTMQNSKDQKSIVMLSNNLLENKSTLKPVEVIYPFQLYLTDEIKKLIDRKTPDTEKLGKYLQELKRCPHPALLTADDEAVYIFINNLLKKMLKELPGLHSELQKLNTTLTKQYEKEKELDLTPYDPPEPNTAPTATNS